MPASAFVARGKSQMRGTRQGRLLCYGLAAVALLAAMDCTSGKVFVGPPQVTAEVAAARESDAMASAVAAAAGAALPLLAQEEVWAKGGVWGPLEGKTSSLVHPFIMPCLFLTTLYTGFLGLKWRETRLISGEISDLKKQLPKDEDPEAPVSSAVKAIKDQIAQLTSDRSELVKGQYKDKHYQTSAILLGGGIFFTVYGVFNTFFRTEKLFPGPHLYAGAAICVCWALAASLVPYMEKGNETARTAHIGLNVINVCLFAWQLPTGFEIFLKVWNNGNLPWF
mmetsp:Transcript_40863/g.89415  ORF Transcript_40863/g.89415 Transcript_40863/m.89415 type:complete len:281 (+) Transcript_40863:29-871(+)